MLKFRWETRFKETETGFKTPKEWEVKNIEQICYVNKSPKRNSTSRRVGFISMEDISTDSYVPCYEITDLEYIRSGKEVFSNSILLAKITPSFEHGKMCITPETTNLRWFATTEIFSINPKDNNNLKYIFYLLKHPSLRDVLENSMSGTSGRQRVQSSALKNLNTPYPSPKEQSRIATVLSWFDSLIENKKRQNDILEKTAMAIFKSWFIDFEPFKNEEFVNSKLGRIPKRWEVDYIIRLVEFNPKVALRKGQIYPFVK